MLAWCLPLFCKPAVFIDGCKQVPSTQSQWCSDTLQFTRLSCFFPYVSSLQEECKAHRLAYGRYYYRFPEGESIADVYDRVAMLEDHLTRDMAAGR